MQISTTVINGFIFRRIVSEIVWSNFKSVLPIGEPKEFELFTNKYSDYIYLYNIKLNVMHEIEYTKNNLDYELLIMTYKQVHPSQDNT